MNSYGQDIHPGRFGDEAPLTRPTRGDETWDEFSERIAVPEQPLEADVWSNEEADRAEESIRDSRSDR